jgi:hypothetical protein
MATLLMLSHHAFRRDLARFKRAVEQIKAGDTSRNAALKTEWDTSYRAGLHGHHMMEDKNIFPDIRGKHPDLATAVDALTDQHHHIDPALEKGDAAYPDNFLTTHQLLWPHRESCPMLSADAFLKKVRPVNKHKHRNTLKE